MGESRNREHLAAIGSRIRKEIQRTTDSAIQKVIGSGKSFEGFAIAMPKLIKLIVVCVLEEYPELPCNDIKRIVEEAAEYGEKEMERYFDSCGRKIENGIVVAGKRYTQRMKHEEEDAQ